MSEYCKDYGDNPDCLGVADERYTMDYTDVRPGSEGLIKWCAHCGPIAQALVAGIHIAIAERGEEFVSEFAAAIDAAERDARATSN